MEEKKNHIFLWSQIEKNPHLCCPDEYLATKGRGTVASGGQGAHSGIPKARNSGDCMREHPKVPIESPALTQGGVVSL